MHGIRLIWVLVLSQLVLFLLSYLHTQNAQLASRFAVRLIISTKAQTTCVCRNNVIIINTALAFVVYTILILENTLYHNKVHCQILCRKAFSVEYCIPATTSREGRENILVKFLQYANAYAEEGGGYKTCLKRYARR